MRHLMWVPSFGYIVFNESFEFSIHKGTIRQSNMTSDNIIRDVVGFIFLSLLLVSVRSFSAETRTDQVDENVSLEALCSNEPVELVSISQVSRLISHSKRAQNDACNTYQNSFNALGDILEIVETGKTCNLELVDKIRRYNNEFIAIKRTDDNKAGDTVSKIPDDLRQFFIALCFQISAECKITMINSLEYDTQGVVSEADYEIIKLFERNKVTLLNEDTEVSDFDDLILLEDLSRSDVEAPQAPSKLLIKVKTNDMIRKLIKTCRNKFKPFYNKLIRPLIELSNLGYNYQGELIARELEELKHNELVKRWYNIVQICEAFKSIEIFEDPDMSLSGDRQAINFISRAEAQELLKKHHLPVEDSIDDSGEEPVSYEPAESHNSDRLWINDQQEIKHLVSKYKAHVSEADRVRSKLLKKLLAQVKAAFKSGQIFSLVGHTVRGVLPTDVNKQNQRRNAVIAAEEFIQLIDDAVEGEETSTTVNEIDSAVAGPKYRKDVPERINFVPKKVDGSKFSTKVYDRTLGAVLPTKWSLFFWVMAIVSILVIILHICA